MKKIISIWLIISLFSLSSSALTTIKGKTLELASSVAIDNYTFLFCGFDDAACNTDTVILLNYDLENNAASFVHIPRDSYFNSGIGQNKINQIVSGLIAVGKSQNEAMDIFVDKLSSALGIKIDGYSAYTVDCMERIVDAVGGVDIDISFDVTIVDTDGIEHNLKKGVNHLNGKQAVAFIRHRKSYSLGDLSRTDAQKVFLSSFINKIRDSFSIEMGIKLLLSGKEGAITDVNFIEILSLAMKNRGRIVNSAVNFVNLPGEAIISSDGISYYAVNKPASLKLFTLLPFRKISEFDKSGKFYETGNADFEKIYYSSHIDFKIYSDDELSKINFYVK